MIFFSPGGALAGRLGVRKGGIGDARQKIIAANRDKTVDARDKLSQLARGQDARQKLQRLKNLKDGNLEVKKLTSGITLTKKLDGKISLSTKSRSESAGEAGGREEVQQIGRLTKTVSSSGQVSLSSRSAASKEEPRLRSASAGSRTAATTSVLRGTAGPEKENVRRSAGSGGRTERFDEELLAFRKTVNMGRSRPGASLARDMERDRSPVRGRGYDYDNPRSPRREREPEPQARRDMIRGEDIVSISPLQGTMVTITNLQSSVTQEDIEELFGDIGALKKAQVC